MFGNIMSKLGFGKDQDNTSATEPAQPTAGGAMDSPPPADAPPPAAPMETVDVVAKLEALARASSQKLDWQVSIVDLLKLLELDSSYGARKELAAELNCPAEKMQESAQMNLWLHKTVLQKLADNGGNIPAELLN
ncbi:DUF3597 domain-containing protein [Pseudomaricurvus hydrocarbonicus]